MARMDRVDYPCINCGNQTAYHVWHAFPDGANAFICPECRTILERVDLIPKRDSDFDDDYNSESEGQNTYFAINKNAHENYINSLRSENTVPEVTKKPSRFDALID